MNNKLSTTIQHVVAMSCKPRRRCWRSSAFVFQLQQESLNLKPAACWHKTKESDELATPAQVRYCLLAHRDTLPTTMWQCYSYWIHSLTLTKKMCKTRSIFPLQIFFSTCYDRLVLLIPVHQSFKVQWRRRRCWRLEWKFHATTGCSSRYLSWNVLCCRLNDVVIIITPCFHYC